MNRKSRFPARCAMLSTLPVTRLSMAMTLWPRSNNRSTKCEPRNPAPPVTTDVGWLPDLCCCVLRILRDRTVRVSLRDRQVGQVSVRLPLLGTRSKQNNGNRPAEYLEVKPQRPVIDVFQVQPHPVGKISHVVLAADLPEASQPRLDAQAPPMRQVVESSDFIQLQRPRTHQAHFTAHHIHQLREFVDAVVADKPADGCDAWIVTQLQYRAGHLVEDFQFVLALLGVGDHRAEFHHHKRLSIQPGALLAEQNRSARRQLDQQGDAEQEWRSDSQQKASPNDVERLLGQTLPG